MSSSFGKEFCVTTWGESHGKAIGVVVDGCPPGIKIPVKYIQDHLDSRKPSNDVCNVFSTRVESDKVEILSGVFNGISMGYPISMIIYNNDSRSKDYSNIKDIFRPGHADYTYYKKYGIRDYRGGGRSSGRETACRVAAGAIASLILNKLNIKVISYTYSIGNIFSKDEDYSFINKNPFKMPDSSLINSVYELVNKTKIDGNSIGGSIKCVISGIPAGIGEPIFDKLEADLAKSVMSIGGVRSFELGDILDSNILGSDFNDQYVYKEDKIDTLSNNLGGIIGGISNGNTIVFKSFVRPPSSIYKKQSTVNISNKNISVKLTGRFDTCIVPRVVPVVSSMASIVLCDHILRTKIKNLL